MLTRQLTVAVFARAAMTISCAPPQAAAPASAPSGQQPKAATKRIVAAIRGDPLTLSDSINWAASGSTVAGVDVIEQLLHSGLLFVDGQGEIRPLLAEAVPTVENGLWKLLPEGRMETTWKLRSDARWHDGHPVTAEDLVFSATVLQDRSVLSHRTSPSASSTRSRRSTLLRYGLRGSRPSSTRISCSRRLACPATSRCPNTC